MDEYFYVKRRAGKGIPLLQRAEQRSQKENQRLLAADNLEGKCVVYGVSRPEVLLYSSAKFWGLGHLGSTYLARTKQRVQSGLRSMNTSVSSDEQFSGKSVAFKKAGGGELQAWLTP